LCMYLLISISQTNGLVMLAPCLGQHITPCDFFLWGYVKGHVYQTLVASLNDLKNRTQGAISTAYGDTLQCTKMELEYRFDIAWWQMVLMLNVMFRINWEFLSQMMHRQCVHVFSYSFYSPVKL
jgi:hypothetical protein